MWNKSNSIVKTNQNVEKKAAHEGRPFPLSAVTDSLCEHLSNGSAAIVYFSNTEKFGRSTAASQYFLQMAGFLGIPVIAWNADNNGLEKVSEAGRGVKLSLCEVSSLDMLARVVRLVKDESQHNSTPETYIYCNGGSGQAGQKKRSGPRRMRSITITYRVLLSIIPPASVPYIHNA